MDGFVETLIRRAADLARHWNLPEQVPKLLKYRENAVFRVRLADGSRAALRLHRPGYHDKAALVSELQWMADLRANGLNVPQPIAIVDGRLLVALLLDDGETQYADLIGWVHGEQIGASGEFLRQGPDELSSIYCALGAAMAEIHNAADAWQIPQGFSRHAWDADGLLGDAPFWGRFWDCPGLSPDDCAFLADLRSRLGRRLVSLASELDYGLIHADLVRENVLVSNGGVALIDFDDCGFGWRLFDITTALLRNRREPHYSLIRRSLISGYRSKRSLSDADLAHLPLFLLLRSLTYLGWVGQRSEMPDAAQRLQRYLGEARELAETLEELV